MNYLQRAAGQRPDLVDELEQVSRLYMTIAYQSHSDEEAAASPALVEFRQAVRQLRKRLVKNPV